MYSAHKSLRDYWTDTSAHKEHIEYFNSKELTAEEKDTAFTKTEDWVWAFLFRSWFSMLTWKKCIFKYYTAKHFTWNLPLSFWMYSLDAVSSEVASRLLNWYIGPQGVQPTTSWV